jgi:hypothetical protein
LLESKLLDVVTEVGVGCTDRTGGDVIFVEFNCCKKRGKENSGREEYGFSCMLLGLVVHKLRYTFRAAEKSMLGSM